MVAPLPAFNSVSARVDNSLTPDIGVHPLKYFMRRLSLYRRVANGKMMKLHAVDRLASDATNAKVYVSLMVIPNREVAWRLWTERDHHLLAIDGNLTARRCVTKK
jgi:hypothetical protein